jgi:transposase InsO family protein
VIRYDPVAQDFLAKVDLDFSRSGKPTDNAYSEAFNSRVRLECLNQHWFLDMEASRILRNLVLGGGRK